MSGYKFESQKLNESQRNVFKFLSQMWIEKGWYDENTNEFYPDSVIDIIEKINSHQKESEPEYIDLLLNSIEVLTAVHESKRIKIFVEGNTFFGDDKFKFVVTCGEKRSIVASAITDYLLSENSSPAVYVEKLHFLKKAASVFEQFGVDIELDEGLKKRNVYKVFSAKPIISESGTTQSNARYSINFKLKLENGREIEVKNSDFFGERPYLKINNDYIILSEDIFDTIKRQRDLENLDLRNAIPLISNPAGTLFAPGTDASKFDLSEYDSRVAGFEFSKTSKMIEIVSHGVEWYKKDGDEIPYIEIRSSSGEVAKVTLKEENLNSIITQMETALQSNRRGLNGDSLPIQIEDGSFLEVSNKNLQLLRAMKETVKERVPKGKNEGLSGNRIAILQPIFSTPEVSTFPDIQVTSADVQRLLSDGIVLKQHQLEGINWLLNSFFQKNGGVILADDMGLGKTLQMIAFIAILKNMELFPSLKERSLHFKSRLPSMVVAPIILLKNWENEIKKFIKPVYLPRVFVLHGEKLRSILKSPGGLNSNWWEAWDIILTNYRTFSMNQVSLLKIPYFLNIFDESQNIKNPDTGQTRAARGLKTQFAICATGTPVENRLLDIWSQVDVLYRKPTNPLMATSTEFESKIEKASQATKKIQSLLRIGEKDAILLRRDKELLRKSGELKNKIVKDPYYIKMTEHQEALEGTIRKKYAKKPLIAIELLQKLFQHPFILGKENYLNATLEEIIDASPKLKLTIDILKEIESKNEKVLVFTLWVKMQVILQEVLKQVFHLDVGIINGDTNRKKSSFENAEGVIDRFSKKDGFNILILSPLAAGAGLNITAANHVVHYGRWWNPAREDQGTDRAYRIGQKKDVYVYYPILQNADGKGFDFAMPCQTHTRKRTIAYDVLNPISSYDAKFENEDVTDA